MAYLHSIAKAIPPLLSQKQIQNYAKEIFSDSNLSLDRLLPVFENALIENRPVLESLEWYNTSHSFSEKNELFLSHALELGSRACQKAIQNAHLQPEDIDAFLVITSSGFVTPTLDARLIDILGLREDVLRLPFTGLGCAGGVFGLARAHEISKLHPDWKVLVLAVETCTLTFRPGDKSKTNLVAFSLFSDGASALILSGEPKRNTIEILHHKTFKLPNSLRVMGWDVEEDGLQVVFDRSIPSIINKYFLKYYNSFCDSLPYAFLPSHYIFHPGGRKVLEAFESILAIDSKELFYSYKVLKEYGNLSSPTVYLVLEEFLGTGNFLQGDFGIMVAMGPGFSCEILLFECKK
jgi:alkylresorcinol/alkylpyrone synthase